MLTNIMVLRTVKENANKAVLDALPSILFEGLHNDKDVQKYYLQGPAAEYIPVNIPDETAKKFSKCATALAMQLILLSNKTKGFFGPEIVSVEGKDILTARNIMNPIMVERNAKYYSTKLNDEVYDAQYAVSEHVIECWEDGRLNTATSQNLLLRKSVYACSLSPSQNTQMLTFDFLNLRGIILPPQFLHWELLHIYREGILCECSLSFVLRSH